MLDRLFDIPGLPGVEIVFHYPNEGPGVTWIDEATATVSGAKGADQIAAIYLRLKAMGVNPGRIKVEQ